MTPSPSQESETTESDPSVSSSRSSALPSAGTEEYLEAIYRLLRDEDRYVKTGELADALKVKPGSVTEMVKKLTEKKYLKYEKNRGFRLTRKGRKLALDVLRRHRVAERLLVDLLGVSWEEAHDVACKWEHVLTPEMCDQVLERLNGPATCPHGNPIPESDGFRYQDTKLLWLLIAKDFPSMARDTARMPSRWSHSCCNSSDKSPSASKLLSFQSRSR